LKPCRRGSQGLLRNLIRGINIKKIGKLDIKRFHIVILFLLEIGHADWTCNSVTDRIV